MGDLGKGYPSPRATRARLNSVERALCELLWRGNQRKLEANGTEGAPAKHAASLRAAVCGFPSRAFPTARPGFSFGSGPVGFLQAQMPGRVVKASASTPFE